MVGLYPAVSRPARLSGIPNGDAGVRATLSAMARIVRAFKTDPNIHELVRQVTAGLPPQNLKGADAVYVNALQRFVRDRITYKYDINGVETLQTPDYTLHVMSGDCDDKSILLATMLESAGYPALFFAVCIRGEATPSHVLAGVVLGTREIPLETIIPAGAAGAQAGEWPPGTTRVIKWSI